MRVGAQPTTGRPPCRGDAGDEEGSSCSAASRPPFSADASDRTASQPAVPKGSSGLGRNAPCAGVGRAGDPSCAIPAATSAAARPTTTAGGNWRPYAPVRWAFSRRHASPPTSRFRRCHRSARRSSTSPRSASRSRASADAAAAASASPGLAGSYERCWRRPGSRRSTTRCPTTCVPLTLAAALAGKHVLCEKPFALRAADLDVLRAVRDAGPHPRSVHGAPPPAVARGARARAPARSASCARVMVPFSYFNADPANIRNRADVGGGAVRHRLLRDHRRALVLRGRTRGA